MSAAILFTGLTFARVAAWAAAFNLTFFGADTFYSIKKTQLWPVVQHQWQEEQKCVTAMLRKRKSKIVLSGDSRCDSPGHNAKYGSYSLKDSASNCIVSMESVESSEVNRVFNFCPFLICNKFLQVKNSYHLETAEMPRPHEKNEG
jgi:hypothetical protein